MNGYDQISAPFARRGRPTVAEAPGNTRSDGAASQTRDGNNRYDTSTPERRRQALAAARRSGNPADEAQVRRQINQEANSSIDALMLGINDVSMARRDNRARRQGGYLQTVTAAEARGGNGNLPPWLQKDGDSSDSSDSGSGGRKRRGRVAESALNPQIKFRETVNKNGLDEARDDKNLPPWLRKDEEDDTDDDD